MAVAATSRWGICLALVMLIFLYLVSYHYHTHPDFKPHDFIPKFVHGRPSTQDWINTALEVEVSDPFDISKISHLCLNRQPRDDVIISCAPGTGGVGNIRSYMLHCIRFAMEAGASLILPNFQRRSTTELAELYGMLGDFEHFFDRQYFIDTLETACPHMKVYEHPDETWTMSNVEIPHWPFAISPSEPSNPSPWRAQFDEWFEENSNDLKRPIVVSSGDPGRDKSVMDDGMEFYFSIGRLLKFRPDVRRLAMVCLAEINNKFKLSMNPTDRIYPNAFLSAHLRTSSDAVKAGWNPDFEGQTDWYINQTLQHNLKVIFAAGGNDLDLQRFAEKALKLDITVVNKHDLLFGNDLREINNLLWDQRGLVDFEILLKASQFGGYARSSFSHNIAFRRHFVSDVVDPFADPDNHFSDELSVVYGRFNPAWEAECVRTLWP